MKLKSLTPLKISLCVFCLFLPLSIAGANIGWGLMLASLLAYRYGGGAIPFSARSSLVEKPLWFFLAASAIASMLGVDPAHSFRYFHQDVHKVWLYLILSVAICLFLKKSDEEEARTILASLALGFAVAAVIGLAQVLLSLGGGAPISRAHAFVSPVTFGEQMSVGFLGVLCFLIQPKEVTHRPAAVALAFLTGTAMILSNTRGAMLACACGAAAVCLVVPRLRKRLFWVLAFSVIGFIVMETARADRSLIAQALGWNQAESHRGQFMRIQLWDAAFRIGRDNLWTGVGHNNFRTVFPQYLDLVMEDGTNTWGTAHNLYLHHFAERGLLGLTALLAFLGALWLRAFQRVRAAADAANLWAFGTITTFLVMNLTEVALQVEILWMLVFFVWIWAEVRHRARHGRASRHAR